MFKIASRPQRNSAPLPLFRTSLPLNPLPLLATMTPKQRYSIIGNWLDELVDLGADLSDATKHGAPPNPMTPSRVSKRQKRRRGEGDASAGEETDLDGPSKNVNLVMMQVFAKFRT